MPPTIFTLTDQAFDFLDQVQASRHPLRIAQAAIEETTADYVEIDEAVAACALAEVVATLRGNPAEGYPKRILKGSVWKQREALLALQGPIDAAISRLQHHPNELQESGDPAEIGAILEDLLVRLVADPDWERAAAVAAYRSPLVRAGDVFLIPTSDGRFGFGRVVKKQYFYVYSHLSSRKDELPIGFRDFLFYYYAMRDEVGSETYPIVGRDPLTKYEVASPAFHAGCGALQLPGLMLKGTISSIMGLASPFPNMLPALPYQLVGMEQVGADFLKSIAERLVQGESSVDRSIEYFRPALTLEDIDRALDALQGRKTRMFDSEENARFGLTIA